MAGLAGVGGTAPTSTRTVVGASVPDLALLEPHRGARDDREEEHEGDEGRRAADVARRAIGRDVGHVGFSFRGVWEFGGTGARATPPGAHAGTSGGVPCG